MLSQEGIAAGLLSSQRTAQRNQEWARLLQSGLPLDLDSYFPSAQQQQEVGEKKKEEEV